MEQSDTTCLPGGGTVTVGDDLRKASLRLPALASSVGAARRLVRRTLPTTAGFEDLVEAAELVMSEAVTNAVVHTGTTIDVTVQFTDSGARLEVRDGTAHQPTPRDCGEIDTQARGNPPVPWSAESDEVRLPSRAFDPVQWDLTTLTAAAGAYIAADDTDGIVAVSDSAAELLGYESPEHLLGHRVVNIIPARDRQAHVACFTLHLLNGRAPLLDTPVVLPLRQPPPWAAGITYDTTTMVASAQTPSFRFLSRSR